MPPRKAKTRGCLTCAERGAARFRWSGQMKSLALVVAIAASLAALTAASSTLSAATRAPRRLNYLWAIPSASGSLTGLNDRHLTLRLIGVRNYLTRFTDRPFRKAYVVANVDFVRRFKHYFAASHPNAVLSYGMRGKAIPIAIVLQLGPPRWDPKTSTLTFPAKRIPRMEDDLPDSTVHIKPPFIPNPRHFDKAGLFIDSASSSCGVSGTAIAAVVC
jgi:hypothetical protein